MGERFKPNPELATQERLREISDKVTDLLQSDDPRVSRYESENGKINITRALVVNAEGTPAPFRLIREKDTETGQWKNIILPLGTERGYAKPGAKRYDHNINDQPWGRRSGTLIELTLLEDGKGGIESSAKVKGFDEEDYSIITTAPLTEGFAGPLLNDLSRPDLRLYSKKRDIIVEDARDEYHRTYKVIPNRGLAKLGRIARDWWG